VDVRLVFEAVDGKKNRKFCKIKRLEPKPNPMIDDVVWRRQKPGLEWSGREITSAIRKPMCDTTVPDKNRTWIVSSPLW
jgi:hypothetical protein